MTTQKSIPQQLAEANAALPKLEFGYRLDLGVTAAWGARAIYNRDGRIELLGDRTSVAGDPEEVKRLCAALDAKTPADKMNVVGLAHLVADMSPLRQALANAPLVNEHLGLDQGSNAEAIYYWDREIRIIGSPKSSGGYLYLSAFFWPGRLPAGESRTKFFYRITRLSPTMTKLYVFDQVNGYAFEVPYLVRTGSSVKRVQEMVRVLMLQRPLEMYATAPKGWQCHDERTGLGPTFDVTIAPRGRGEYRMRIAERGGQARSFDDTLATLRDLRQRYNELVADHPGAKWEGDHP